MSGVCMLKVKDILLRAKKLGKAIALAEGDSDRVLRATEILLKRHVCKVILVGNPDIIMSKGYKIKGAVIMDPATSSLREELATALYEKRKNKGMTNAQANETVLDRIYFATMLVECGYADGLVSGVETSTADSLRPALQIIKTADGIKTVSSCVMFVGTKKLGIGENNVIFTADCALNISPDREQLADITYATVDTARKIAMIEPKVAMLSFSTKGSGGNDPKVIAMQEAYDTVLSRKPNFDVDGELQLDAAIVDSVAKKKAPDSKVAGHANVLIFPDLQSGNIGYKLIERFGGLKAIGQICQGFRKPVNDMSRGCGVEDIVTMTAITILQTNN